MKISERVLRGYTDLPDGRHALRELLEEVGVEVKRLEEAGDDAVLNLELLANRGDHYCYAGVAREASGRTGAAVRLPRIAPLESVPADARIRVDTELCMLYTGTYLERLDRAGSLEEHWLKPLIAAGLKPVSAPVDATNLANLELGQPTHAFDADKLEGTVVIRESRAGESAWPLFTEERVELPEGTMVIADDVKILAIAGVIGCEESKTTEATTRLLLESATFDPVSVRKASRALGIHTDSSARFERGSDPSLPLVGAGRVVLLLEEAGWRRSEPTLVAGDWTDPERTIRLDVAAASRFIEHRMAPAEVKERLERYGFAVSEPDGDVVTVRVPPGRLWDVEFPADLYEELAKSVGYNESPVTLPEAKVGVVPTHAQEVKRRVEEVLLGQGFYEVLVDGFYGRDLIERAGIGEGHPLFSHVETLNSLERGYSLLKNNTLLQALDGIAANLRMRNPDVKMYEWTRTFHPDAAADNGLCTERAVLWAAATGHDRAPSWSGQARPADAWFLKGLVAEIAVELGIELEAGPADPDHPLHGLLHPGRQAAVRLDGTTVGIFGEAHPGLCQAFRIKRARPVLLELEVEALRSPGTRPRWEMPPELHPIVRSLAFTLPARVTAGEVAAHLRTCGPAWLEQVAVTDLYEHDDGGGPLRTVTFELTFAGSDARTADEVNAVGEALIEAVTGAFGERGVVLR